MYAVVFLFGILTFLRYSISASLANVGDNRMPRIFLARVRWKALTVFSSCLVRVHGC